MKAGKIDLNVPSSFKKYIQILEKIYPEKTGDPQVSVRKVVPFQFEVMTAAASNKFQTQKNEVTFINNFRKRW